MIRRRKHRDRDGATMVETAFVLPVFFLLLIGLIEFARAFMVIQMVNAAAREGAALGMLDGTTSGETEDIIRDFLKTGGIEDGVQIEILDGTPYDERKVGDPTPDPGSLTDLELIDAAPRQLAIVRISVPFKDVSWVTPFWLGDVTIQAQVAMRHE